MDKEDVYMYIHIIYICGGLIYMEYYSTITENEILLFAVMWMDLEGIMLSEMRQRKTNTV